MSTLPDRYSPRFISTRETQYDYFNEILERPDWRTADVLDFGGNVAGFLTGAGEAVPHERYWCIDLNRAAIEQGRLRFPRAHFIHYDRYSSEFNPVGVRSLAIPDNGSQFDIIMAFSVFTHTHQTEMLELVSQLRALLKPGGRLAFTFCDPSYERTTSDPRLPRGTDLRKHLAKRKKANPALEIESMIEAARLSRWCILIDEKLYIEPDPGLSHQERTGEPWESYCSYFSIGYMESLFPDARILPPVSPEWQHCCLLEKK